MAITNMHIHSEYSFDGNMSVETIAKISLENNIKYAALTDHVEFIRETPSEVIEKLKKRNKEIDMVNEKYNGKLKLLKAVEVSEPHLYQDQVKRLEELDLDFIMGSIHNIDRSAKTIIEKKYTFREYYKELLKMVEHGNFDVVSHLDYILRYYDKDYSEVKQLFELMKAIVEKNLIIELNTSAKRRINNNQFPSLEKICHYRAVGGKYVTVGSDAHNELEIPDNLISVDYLMKDIGLEAVIYQKRKIERI